VFLWGGMFVSGKLTVLGMPPLAASTLRFAVASAAFAAALAIEWRRGPSGTPSARAAALGRHFGLLVLLGATGVFANAASLLVGLTLAPAVHAALLVPTSNPIATALLAALLLRERLTGRAVAGLAIALAGVALVVAAGRGAAPAEAPTDPRTILLGDACFLVTVASWSLYTVFARRAMTWLTPLEATAGSSLAGALLLFAASLFEGRWAELAAAPPLAWAGLAYITGPGTVVAFVLWNGGVARLGASRAAVFLYVVPVVGAAASALLLGERLVPSQLAGAALVMAGVWLTTTGRPTSARSGSSHS
jgi:drug/metabolite transporter (DMT)-like permease